MTRVVVVGGGLAGAAAALEVVRGGGQAHLVSQGPGATALSWGSLDVAVAVPGSRRLRWRTPLRDAPLSPSDRLKVLVGAYRAHPYAVLWGRHAALGDAAGGPGGEAPDDAVKRAVVGLDDALAPQGLRVRGSLESNRLLANVRGAVRVADFAFTGPAEGDLSEAEEIVLVGIPGLEGFEPRAAARMLAAELHALGLPPRPIRVVSLRLPDGLAAVRSVSALAAALDGGHDGGAARSALIEAVAAMREEAAGTGRLYLFPPILGLEHTAGILETLRQTLAAPAAELLGAPSCAAAGDRLDRALGASLAAAGVQVHTGRVTSVLRRADRAAGVSLAAGDREAHAAQPQERLEADAVILATGRFLAGGLEEDDRGVREPLLRLPLYDDRGQRIDGSPARAALRRRYLDAQPLFSGGVRVDASQRPLGEGGTPVLEGLFAAGSLIGGFDPARERTGLGVALVTGCRAAQRVLAEERS